MSIYHTNVDNCQTIPDPLYVSPSSGNATITFVPNVAYHIPVPYYDNDVLPQVDGPPPSPPSNREPAPLVQAVNQPLRRANYVLDREKQLSRLCKDTNIDNFDITVSPIAQNVTIKCSTGFYTKVVLPTFSGMTLQYSTTVNGVRIQCIKVDGQTDETGMFVTTLVKFELNYEQARDKPTIGTVAVHLHHTARKVQLQGSSIVNDQLRAPVWFVDHFLKGIFNFYAREKAVNITKFNEAVHDMLTNHLHKLSSHDKCGICGSLMVGRTLLVSCPGCKKKFHKNCSSNKEHRCNQPVLIPASLPSTTNRPQSGTASLSSITTPISLSLVTSSLVTTTVVFPTVSSSQPSLSTLAVISSQSTPLMSTSTQSTGSTAPLWNPTAPSFLPRALPTPQLPPPTDGPPPSEPLPSSAPPPTQAQGRTKQPKKKGPPPPPQNLSLEFANLELNSAQAANIVLETTITDLKFKNGLLEDRVKQLEAKMKEDIFDKYFPPPNTMRGSGSQNQTIHSHPGRGEHCCLQPTHCCAVARAVHPCGSSCNVPSNNIGNFDQLKDVIEELNAELQQIKSKLSQLLNSSCPLPPSTMVFAPSHSLPSTQPLPGSSHTLPCQSPSTTSTPPYPSPCTYTPSLLAKQPSDLNSSFVSLDHEMSEVDHLDYLNCE